MIFSSEACGDALVVRVEASRIDAASAMAFKDQFRAETRGKSGRVVLDMAAVEFVDSSGLGAIVAMLKALNKTGQMDLAGLQPTVAKLFRLTRLDTIFTIHNDRDSALKAV